MICGLRVSPKDIAALRAEAGAGVQVLAHEPNLLARIAGARMSVSQAGYDNVAEALAVGAPLVLVSFAQGDDEQTRRALRLDKGAWRLRESQFAPMALKRAADAATQARIPRFRVAIDSGEQAAALLAEAVRGGRP